MSIIQILDTLLFKPLQLLFEVIYIIANRVIGDPGLSIVVLSLVMNFLVLPLYRRADVIQEEERDMEYKLQRGVAHIKKTFSGDERMMMLQTYYRQNNYKPTYVLRGAISLFLEMPFFIAAYRFLSDLQLLRGVAFGPIPDLGKPDGILFIAGVSINILPIIMTAINMISCVIFTKNSPLKSKIQLYAMAIFFLIFLYSSLAGLVFYWTLNNIFSLGKTIFYKLKNPWKVLRISLSMIGAVILVYGICFYKYPTFKRIFFLVGCGILLQLPFIYSILERRFHFQFKVIKKNSNKKIFYSGTIFLTVLIGLLIPSAVIKASPQEFIDVNSFYHPIWFIMSSFCMALGTFVIWGGVFYWLAKPFIRPYFDRAIWILSGISVVNYMFFGRDLGILTPRLKYENGLDFAGIEQLCNVVIIIAVILVLCAFYEHWEKVVSEVLIISILSFGIMSVFNMLNINTSIESVREQALEWKDVNKETPNFTLSKTGKNVIILMLDRAMGEYIPYLFDEKPELKDQFAGFVYYSNVISFGGCTNFGSPALLGGYEYTPVEINKRDKESLVSKQNEALKVMPVLFAENDFEVTICEPTYANYSWIPDLSIYDDYPDIRSYITKGRFISDLTREKLINDNKRNFFCYSILKSVPLCFQSTLYDYGKYNQVEDDISYSEQKLINKFISVGISAPFMANYSVLENLSGMTNVVEDNVNTFLYMENDTTHEAILLQEPDYVPAQYVDNTKFQPYNQDRVVEGRTLKMETGEQMIHYHANMATLLQLGKWFDYMRKNGVYDNTRIILVSDHGRESKQLDELILNDGLCVSWFYPLLMVKDFNSEGFTTSEEFMTNGDVPALAVANLIDNPMNPFTGKTIDSSEKLAHDQYVIASREWDVNINNGNTFLPANWYSVHDNIWEKDNWRLIAEDAVLAEIDE